MKKKRRKKIEAFDVILFIVMLFIMIITVYPFLNVLAVSLNDASDTIKGGIHIWPRVFTLNNYKSVFDGSTKIPLGFVNSVIRTIVGTATGVISTAMVAFVLSRRDFVFNRFVTILFVVTMYVSGGLIPEYLVIRNLGLINKFNI